MLYLCKNAFWGKIQDLILKSKNELVQGHSDHGASKELKECKNPIAQSGFFGFLMPHDPTDLGLIC